jgi:hypothetical protein
MATGTDTSLTPSLEAMLGPQLTAEQARRPILLQHEADHLTEHVARLLRQAREAAQIMATD